MNAILKHLVDTEFRDLAGTRIEGQIALSDELVNLGIRDVLTGLTTPQNPAPAAPPQPAPAAADDAPPAPTELLRHLRIDHLKYRTEAGRTILEIRAGR